MSTSLLHSHSQTLYFLSLRHLIAIISFHAMGKSVDLDGHSFLIGIIEFKVKSKWTCMFTQTCTHERERERERERIATLPVVCDIERQLAGKN